MKILKLSLLSVIFLAVFSGVCVFSYSYIFQYETINFNDLPGISQKALKQRGILYEVDEVVIYYPHRSNRPYLLMVKPKNTELFGFEPVAFEGTPDDFNMLINELVFVTEKNGSYTSYAAEFGKGGVDAITKMVSGFVDIIRHPVQTAKALGKFGKDTIAVSKKIITGELKFSDIKNSVDEFADKYWFDYKCRQAEKNGFDYRKIVFPITESTINSYCTARICGEGTVEVATVFVGFLKVSKAGKAGTLNRFKKSSKLGSVFKYSKKDKVKKPEILIGEIGNNKYKFLINKAQKAGKSGKSIATPQWFAKGIEKTKQLYYKVRYQKVSKEKYRKRRAEYDNRVRKEFWEKEAEKNPSKWSKENLERMMDGNPPLDENGISYELHHVRPLEYGGKNKSDNLVIMRRDHHRFGENKTKNHTPPFKNKEEFIKENGLQELNS